MYNEMKCSMEWNGRTLGKDGYLESSCIISGMRTSTKTKAIYREEAEEDGLEEESVGPSDQWDTEVPGLDA